MTVDAASAKIDAPHTAERRFRQSMAVSGTRCLLTYLVFPYLLPVLGLADSMGPAISVPIGLVAMVFNGEHGKRRGDRVVVLPDCR